ncbi:acid phosphatase [Macrolepiota fuliginosa MF-IS2]|uniref:Acid phosphatase n=1 Tax=Macrolepiota fuliginosa MF-IS2 TaxID=1400762 RepID=A0A9P6CBE1_9AGAR|nr:acid phosphatase [Macrolepiota fuliginosa MF-IS2]
MAFSGFLYALLVCAQFAESQKQVSSGAGSTQTFMFPPSGVTATVPDPNFPDGTKVGFAGATPTGDEAAAMATAPSFAPNHNHFPLVQPIAADADNAHDFDVLQHLGNLSPWRSVPSKNYGLPGASPVVPSGCEVVQVHLVHRHGARYPADGGPATFAGRVHEIANSPSGFNATGRLKFLRNWTYKLGAELLTPFGRSQLYDLGVGFRIRYGELLKDFKDLPVFRTTSQARMLDSALNFAAGFFGLQDYAKSYHQLIEVESQGFNSTLAPYFTCPNANNEIAQIGYTRNPVKWQNAYLSRAQRRLANQLPGFNLTIADCFNMQQLCAYETVALGYSQFCGLFDEEEWEGYAYASALQIWYGAGPGNPATAAMGIGYVQELVSRLTKTRITEFNTSVNKSIVTNEILFPLDQPIYVDATHDTVMSTIYVAMNFTSFIRSGPLPADYIPDNVSYKTNEVNPFAVNLVGQVLSCPASGTPTHIRWILNDGVLPLTGISGCKHNKNGMCEIDTFINGMKQRIAEVDYQFGCFGNYTFPEPDGIVDGQLPMNLRH